MTLNIRPLGDRILVEAVEEKEVKKGGIIIPGHRQGKAHGKPGGGPRHWENG